MKLEDCKYPTSYTTLTLPEEEPLIMPYDTNKSTLRTISNKKPQFQPSSSLQVPHPPPPPSAGRTPLQRQSSRCQSSIALKEYIQRAKQESWEDDSTNAATTHDATNTGTTPELSSPNHAPPSISPPNLWSTFSWEPISSRPTSITLTNSWKRCGWRWMWCKSSNTSTKLPPKTRF
uniref:Uncharacterized protein n=1 Tax=Proboscia inermis TaxID=420281 RepID=A0A7S0CED4_9STRA|mmetsp:Transcript_43506/g.44019  ORF Transcript_43506/g.44019 Transcript_43506/m.44019 type:complete len:176 (+) Transcript_43506:275-802(+)